MRIGIAKRIIAIIMLICMLLSFSLIDSIAAETESSYKQSLRNKGFPELYLNKLWQVHQAHPNWKFEVFNTGLDWDTAVDKESSDSRNLVYINPKGLSATRLYRSQSYGAYTSKCGFDYDYAIRDGVDSEQRGWTDASPMAVAYYMNPYTFIGSDVTILQFESLAWNFSSLNAAEAVVETMLSGTFMSKSRNSYNANYVGDNGNIIYRDKNGKWVATDETFAHAICSASQKNNLNPCYLTSKIIGEVGTQGSGSTTGTHGTYPGRYNYLNVGAYESSTGQAVTNGLKYADDHGWLSPQLAISGGAEFVAKNYISRGQNTSYLQKFNLTSNNTYNHQYMGAVNGVVNTTYNTYSGYKKYGILDSEKTFYIPVFKNMPNGSSSSIVASGYSTLGVMNDTVNVRSNAGKDYSKVSSISAGQNVNILGGFRDQRVAYDPNYGTDSTYYRMYTPLWYKIADGQFVCEDYVDTNATLNMSIGNTANFKYALGNGNESPRFMSWDSRIATVDTSGKITAKKVGSTRVVAYLLNGSFAVIKVNVDSNDTTPTALSSSTYSVNNTSEFVSKVPSGTTAATFKSQIKESAYIKVTKSGTELADNALVTTGCEVSIISKVNGKVLRKYTVIVTGDINIDGGVGDGKITITDLLAIRDHLLAENGKLTGVNYKAADVTGDGSVNITDLIKIRDYLLGSQSITPIAY